MIESRRGERREVEILIAPAAGGKELFRPAVTERVAYEAEFSGREFGEFHRCRPAVYVRQRSISVCMSEGMSAVKNISSPVSGWRKPRVRA